MVSIAQLKKWFGRGAYPTAEQFAALFVSFWHKGEKITLESVDGLPERLNGKYERHEAEELERSHAELSDGFARHGEENAAEFANVWKSARALEASDGEIRDDLKGAHADIGALQETGRLVRGELDRMHTTDQTQQKSLELAHSDIGAIREMLQGGATLAQAKAALVALGENYKDLYAVAATLKSFLASKDTAESTINTWKEIEGFLQGISDTQSLTGLLAALETKVTEAYRTAIGAAVKTERDRAEKAEDTISRGVTKEKVRAEGAEAALGERITQTDTDYKRDDTKIRQDIAALRQTILGILTERADRVTPLTMRVTPPSRITLGNTVKQYIKAELLPSFAVQNVLFLGDCKAVDVEPDGAVTVLGLGKSHIHVIPTENTALHQSVDIEVVQPSFVTDSDGGLLMAGDSILLT